MNNRKYNIDYQTCIKNWDEALPLGNGKIGCLIYGDGPLRLSLDRVDLWDSRPNPVTKEEGFTYANLLRLCKSGKIEDRKEYLRLFDDISMNGSYPSKITAGRIELNFGRKEEKIYSNLDIWSAVAEVKIGTTHKVECFLSATEYVGVARVNGVFSLQLHIPNYISDKGKDGLGYPLAKIVQEGEFTYYEQETFTDFRYGIVVLRKNYEDYDELYFTVATNDAGNDWLTSAKKELLSVAEKGYRQLKERHVAWWRQYWKKSSIRLGDELLEKTYYRSWYLFASCSRQGFYPMPLQGVWTADNDMLPPWKGDYHHDTNTELSYQAYLKANRLEEGRVFVDYLWSFKDVFRQFAKNFYGINGLLLPSTSTLDGKAVGGWIQYSYSPMMTVWVAQSFDEYWLYTGDKVFLKERAYPFFKEVGEAICNLLEERNGKLHLPLSSSPEIFDNTPRAFLTPNSNFDLALLHYLYKTLVKYSKILKKDASIYEDIVKKLDDIAVDEEGVILLDKTQRLPESHRHFSHVMALYPLHLINYDTEENKRIYQSTLLHLEQLGTGWWVGFSFAMSAQLYAMANNGNAAYEKLRTFAKGYVADNGFHLNGDFRNYGFSQWHYRPFTLESLFGYCDALQEMLLQEHQGFIDVFPAVPQEWKDISFKRLRSYRGVLVSAKKQKGALYEIVLESKSAISVRLKNNFNGKTLLISTKELSAEVVVEEKELFQVAINGKVRITLKD